MHKFNLKKFPRLTWYWFPHSIIHVHPPNPVSLPSFCSYQFCQWPNRRLQAMQIGMVEFRHRKKLEKRLNHSADAHFPCPGTWPNIGVFFRLKEIRQFFNLNSFIKPLKLKSAWRTASWLGSTITLLQTVPTTCWTGCWLAACKFAVPIRQ